MTFEEFFVKKRIDLAGLQAGEPALFLEFKTHFEAMGEKSFDHTKKYWFNKLRLRYHLQPEQKPEKVRIENKLAEQTIVETLTESVPGKAETAEEASTDNKQAPMAKPAAFKPRFKPGMQAAKHIGEGENATSAPDVNEAAAKVDQAPAFQQEKEAMQAMADQTARTTDGEPAEKAADAPMTKPAGFKPRFNAKAVPPKSLAPEEAPQEPTVLPDEQIANAPAATDDKPAAKPAGFKPRFNAKTMAKPSAPATDAEGNEAPPAGVQGSIVPTTTAATAEPADTERTPAAAKPAGFKPRFNAKTMAKPSAPATDVEGSEASTAGIQDSDTTATTAATAERADMEETPTAAKPAGFKPRFNAKMVQKPASPAEVADSTPATTSEGPAMEAPTNAPADAGTTSTDEEPDAKPAYKPRFNMKNVKPKPPEEQS